MQEPTNPSCDEQQVPAAASMLCANTCCATTRVYHPCCMQQALPTLRWHILGVTTARDIHTTHATNNLAPGADNNKAHTELNRATNTTLSSAGGRGCLLASYSHQDCVVHMSCTVIIAQRGQTSHTSPSKRTRVLRQLTFLGARFAGQHARLQRVKHIVDTYPHTILG